MEVKTRPLTIDEIFAKPLIIIPEITPTSEGIIPALVTPTPVIPPISILPETVNSTSLNSGDKSFMQKNWFWILLGTATVAGIGFYLVNKNKKINMPPALPQPPTNDENEKTLLASSNIQTDATTPAINNGTNKSPDNRLTDEQENSTQTAVDTFSNAIITQHPLPRLG